MAGAYIGGTFDLIHPGHIQLFMYAKKKYGKVTVSLNRNEFVQRFKGKKLVYTLQERMMLVSAIRWVDEVTFNHGDENSLPSIIQSGADVIIAGPDWNDRARYIKQLGLSETWLDNQGISLDFFDGGYERHGADIKKDIRSDS